MSHELSSAKRKGKRMPAEKNDLRGEDVRPLNVNANEVAAATRAVHDILKGVTFVGVNLGSHMTTDQCRQVVTAAISAIESFRSASANAPLAKAKR